MNNDLDTMSQSEVAGSWRRQPVLEDQGGCLLQNSRPMQPSDACSIRQQCLDLKILDHYPSVTSLGTLPQHEARHYRCFLSSGPDVLHNAYKKEAALKNQSGFGLDLSIPRHSRCEDACRPSCLLFALNVYLHCFLSHHCLIHVLVPSAGTYIQSQ